MDARMPNGGAFFAIGHEHNLLHEHVGLILFAYVQLDSTGWLRIQQLGSRGLGGHKLLRWIDLGIARGQPDQVLWCTHVCARVGYAFAIYGWISVDVFWWFQWPVVPIVFLHVWQLPLVSGIQSKSVIHGTCKVPFLLYFMSLLVLKFDSSQCEVDTVLFSPIVCIVRIWTSIVSVLPCIGSRSLMIPALMPRVSSLFMDWAPAGQYLTGQVRLLVTRNAFIQGFLNRWIFTLNLVSCLNRIPIQILNIICCLSACPTCCWILQSVVVSMAEAFLLRATHMRITLVLSVTCRFLSCIRFLFDDQRRVELASVSLVLVRLRIEYAYIPSYRSFLWVLLIPRRSILPFVFKFTIL